jgi:hypothetical protein
MAIEKTENKLEVIAVSPMVLRLTVRERSNEKDHRKY